MGAVIDFHSHILPGMDDGSESVDMTRGLLEQLKAQDVDVVCATPHYYRGQNDIDVFLARRDKAINRMSEIFSETEGIKILIGAEVAYFSGIAECEDLGKLCLEGTRVLLLEMPFTVWTPSQMEDVLQLQLDKGYKVVLAHPERFLFDKNNQRMVEKMCDAGVGLQVNAETLVSWRYKKLGLNILTATDYPFIGSDCHDLKQRAPRIKDARKVIKHKLGAEFLSRLDKGMNEAIGSK